MPPTLGMLLERAELRLRAVVPGESRRPISWVHVSELDDPTPYLTGGELLLTTGLNAVDTDEHWDSYVRRLVRSEVAALGFGVDIRFHEIPEALVVAARRCGLPLLLVPGPVPFIAISKTVASAWGRREQRSLGSIVDAQRDLIKSAVSATGPRSVLEQLAKALDAWILLLDADGALDRAYPHSARRHSTRVQLDFDRFPSDRFGATALDIADESVAVLPIVVHESVGGFLVVGRPDSLNSVEHSIIATAVSLLALDLSGTWRARQYHRRSVLAVLRLLLSGHADVAARVGEPLEIALPSEPVRIAVLGASAERTEELVRTAEQQQGLRVAGALVAEYEPNRVAVLLPVAEGDLLALEEVLHRVPNTRGAVSDGVAFADLPDAWRRARSVFFESEASGRLVATADVATEGLLSQLNNPNSLTWASTLLEPLERQTGRSRLSLISTLRVFLAHNGQMEASATVLGIHRHTLRYRLDRITELLGHELDDPTARAELWIALRLRELN